MQSDSVLRRWYLSRQKECIYIICFLNQYNTLPADVVKYIIYLYTNTYWDNIKLLKAKYYGKEDAYVEEYNCTSHKLNIKFHETMEISGIRNGDRSVLAFPKSNLNKYVYKNLRTVTNLDTIRSYELQQSGCTLDRIYVQTFSSMRFIYGIHNESILPFSFCKNNEYLLENNADIHIQCFSKWNIIVVDEKISLLVDIYEIIDDDKISYCVDGILKKIESKNTVPYSVITQTQFTGEDFIYYYVLPCAYKLNFYCVINYIIINIPKGQPINFHLTLGEMYPNFSMIDAIIYNNQYIIPFTKYLNNFNYGINFSQINHQMLTIKFDKNINYDRNDCISVYAIGYNGVQTICNSTNIVFN